MVARDSTHKESPFRPVLGEARYNLGWHEPDLPLTGKGSETAMFIERSQSPRFFYGWFLVLKI
jgi:hypothetical protein